ncbi:MAG: 3-phosphoshikimate 1-carboxyvinyltransferase [Dissulfurimicrobium sp.]|uniref:3-phosphoshikimate 1-carboxyvinyltransferase n=1 Tax=Dissulfurimicrobium TaxID=1769732 RepID=UPI001EDBAA5D|nr:3-phosphoshikimate 1-carboxyvinyltransferase [Dissulfurimicrobium hydrothermale]UKL14177.1 3-phosphoshikimate 1-carboxyvinyltransferase [Dissulfurimicrobium hydrothermale]
MAGHIEITPVSSSFSSEVRVPGSKSITQRALIAAALAKGRSRLADPLDSEDTRLLREALRALGVRIKEVGEVWVVDGTGGEVVPCANELYLGNNGTGIRFLASFAALGKGVYRLTGSRRMEERPIGPLLDALNVWGAEARSINGTGCPPVEIRAKGLEGGAVRLSAAKSSQFLSSLLLIGPYARTPAVIELAGPLVSRPYVDMTIAVMSSFGVDVLETDGRFLIPQGGYRAADYQVEGDASSASYFWAAAAVTGGRVRVLNIHEHSLQGDAWFADVLGRMGCRVEKGSNGVTVEGPADGALLPVEIDMVKMPDVVPTLAVTAAFAKGVTHIKNVAHLRIKETDRIRAVAAGLARLGVRVEELPDGLIIHGGGSMHGAGIETYDDHRIAMAFAVAGLKVKGVVIEDPDCVAKSFPSFWELWKDLY